MAQNAGLGQLQRLITLLCAHTGIGLFDDVTQQKSLLRNPRIWIFIAIAVLYPQVTIFTVYKAEDRVHIVHSACASGFIVQTLFVGLTMFLYRKELGDEFVQINSYYSKKANLQESGINSRCVGWMVKISKAYLAVFLVSVCFIVVTPLGRWALFGVRDFPVPISLPFIDNRHSPGFEITFLFQTLVICHLVPFLCGFQIFYIVFVLHFGNLVDLMVHRMQQNSPSLADVIQLHNRLLSVHNNIERYFGFFTSVHIICTVSQVSLCLYISLEKVYIQGFFFIFLSLVQLFFTCCYGYFVETQAESLAAAIFNSSNWPEMPLVDQKAVCFMLAVSQYRQQLRAGGGFFLIGFNMYLKVRFH